MSSLASALGADLVGVYLHGSLAMGSYYRPKSDIDLLAVTERPLSAPRRRAVAHQLLREWRRRPTAGGVEATVMLRRATQSPTHPMSFETHFSEQWAPVLEAGEVDFELDRTDADLAAHCTTTRARGIRLLGSPIPEVFSPVLHGDFLAAIGDDLDWILAGDHLAESPFYGVLNCCRVLMILDRGPGCVPSKDEGGRWALNHLPSAHRPLVEQALACYRSQAPVTEEQRASHGHHWDRPTLMDFRDYVADQIRA